MGECIGGTGKKDYATKKSNKYTYSLYMNAFPLKIQHFVCREK